VHGAIQIHIVIVTVFYCESVMLLLYNSGKIDAFMGCVHYIYRLKTCIQDFKF